MNPTYFFLHVHDIFLLLMIRKLKGFFIMYGDDKKV